MKVCAEPGCPALVRIGSRCTVHTRDRDRARGTRQQRGYDAEHDRLRAEWSPRVATGRVACARCRRPIPASAPWDLGHDDHDRTSYRGPEHQHCNRSAGGKSAHQRREPS